ncbi:MAG: nicotinate phosphoribosyltransferase [Chlamydiae bacterium]|nr:nicotinate phosphoribosyltransferase [Chlamydiota bacterium]
MKQDPFFSDFYKSSLALLTDLYEITMAYCYWQQKIADKQASFYYSFRKKPFKGQYAVVAGLKNFIEYVERLKFDSDDIQYLSTLNSPTGEPLFEPAFLLYLSEISFCFDIDAMPEGSVCFPNEPIIRVTGPILQVQLIESALLNIMNFQTLIATKASRICFAAGNDPVVEFGLRRAQGIDGAVSASRAAYIGGCCSTSNTLAGKLFGIPVVGTHAHSWIMAFDTEYQALYAYSQCMPSSCIFLIDTYDSISGVKNAIHIARELRQHGNEMIGVRIDSGSLEKLSKEIRALLDNEGFPDAKIMATNDLDEFSIQELKAKGSAINMWGVGTNLVTGKEQPALDGVYKLSALRDDQGLWHRKLKISDDVTKVTTPGLLQVRRYTQNKQYVADVVFDELLSSPEDLVFDFYDEGNEFSIIQEAEYKDLLIPVVRAGRSVYTHPSLKQIREYAKAELMSLPKGIKILEESNQYFLGIEKNLYSIKKELLNNIKKKMEL